MSLDPDAHHHSRIRDWFCGLSCFSSGNTLDATDIASAAPELPSVHGSFDAKSAQTEGERDSPGSLPNSLSARLAEEVELQPSPAVRDEAEAAQAPPAQPNPNSVMVETVQQELLAPPTLPSPPALTECSRTAEGGVPLVHPVGKSRRPPSNASQPIDDVQLEVGSPSSLNTTIPLITAPARVSETTSPTSISPAFGVRESPTPTGPTVPVLAAQNVQSGDSHRHHTEIHGYPLQSNPPQVPAIENEGLVSQEHAGPLHHHGHIFNATNTFYGPTVNIRHIENANFPTSDQAVLWDSLPKQREMGSQRNEYMEASRDDVVQDVWDWVDKGFAGELVLWIHAAAGLGKSTLAHHLTYRLRAAGRLAASVVLNGDNRSPESVIKMLAREIGTTHPTAIPMILAAISSCNSASLRDHVEKYLRDPICSLQHSSSLVIILDAIDEWELHGLLIKALVHLVSSSSSLKIILLGRSDPRARDFEQVWIRPYLLRPVPAATMERYFAQELASVKWDNRRGLTSRHATQLAELANGLFIWASVVCSLLKKRLSRSSPNETLEAIIYSRRSLGDGDGLAGLYHQAILWLFPDSEAKELLRNYLGATVALQEPLPLTVFASLSKVPVHTIETLMSDLKTLQIRQPVDSDSSLTVYPAMTLFHLSFLEYIQSSSTRPDIAFQISAFDSHSQFAESCLLELPRFLPIHHPPGPDHLSAEQKYVVKYMPIHVHNGTPSANFPDSNAEWERSKHASLLQAIVIPVLAQWGRLFVGSIKPGSDAMVDGDFTEHAPGQLMRGVAARLEGGEMSMLSFRIPCLEVAVRLRPGDVDAWHDLGRGYKDVLDSTQSVDACNQAVKACRNALQASTMGNSTDDGRLLVALATSLGDRNNRLGEPNDLAEAITLQRSALTACPPGHLLHLKCLNNLANYLNRTGSIGDLQESIRLHRKMLEFCPPGHPQRLGSLNNLAVALQKTRSMSDRSESTRFFREVVDLTPQDDPNYPNYLNNLARALRYAGSADNLGESIHLLRKALEFHSQDHPARPASLTNLAGSLQATGSQDDLREAIQLLQEALELRPPGHPGRPISLNDLALCFRRAGTASDLRESIRLHREVLELYPPSLLERWMSLCNLAGSLQDTGSVADLRQAVHLHQEAVDLCPPGHPRRPTTLNDLAWSLRLLHEAVGSLHDLEESILDGRESLALTPVGHPERRHVLETLAMSLRLQPQHLDESLVMIREAISTMPKVNWESSMNFATILLSHYERSGYSEDLEEAASRCEQALSLCPPDHFRRPKLLALKDKVDSTRSGAPLPTETEYSTG